MWKGPVLRGCQRGGWRRSVFHLFLLGTIASFSGAIACDCAQVFVSDSAGDLRAASVVADTVVERLRPGKAAGVTTVTFKVERGWKGIAQGESFEANVGETSCTDWVPEIHSKGAMEPFIRVKGKYFFPICMTGPSPEVVKAYAREREGLEAAALASPEDLPTQIALAAHFNYWQEPQPAIALLEKLALRAPQDPLVQHELALAYLNAGEPEKAQRANYAAYSAPELKGRVALLGDKIAQASESRASPKKQGETRVLINSERVLNEQELTKTLLSNIVYRSRFEARNSDWSGSRLLNVGFDEADFSGATFDDAFFKHVSLSGSKLSGLQAQRYTCFQCSFVGAQLRGLNAPSASLYGAKLEHADLGDAELLAADLRAADMTGATLVGTRLDEANLSKAVLSGAIMDRASLQRASLKGADLRGADLSRALLSGAQLDLARVDCDTRFPSEIDRRRFMLIPMAQCPGDEPLELDLSNNPSFAVDFKDAYLVNAKLRLSPWARFEGTHLDGSEMSVASSTAQVTFANVSARDAVIDDFIGQSLWIQGVSDFSGARIAGKEVVMPVLHLSSRNLRLDNALLRNVAIEIGANFFLSTDSKTPTSIAGLRVEQSKVICSGAKPVSARVLGGAIATTRANENRDFLNFIQDLALARRLAALDPSNTLEEGCAKAIGTYLSNSCEKGFASVGYKYLLPQRAVSAVIHRATRRREPLRNRPVAPHNR